MFDLSNLGSLADLAKQMEQTYADGADVVNQAGDRTAEEINPDHQIQVEIELSAKIDGHSYAVDSHIVFEIELNPILQAADSPAENLSSLLDGLDVDLGDDKEAVMEQLGQPRAVGVVKKIKTKNLQVSNGKGKVEVELNDKGTVLATIINSKVLFNFEGVFSYPNNPDLLVAIPSMDKMQEHIAVDVEKLYQPIDFSWVEKDKDGLSVAGSLKVSKLEK